MKFGPRKPNFKSRVKARTTGKLKRQAKKAINPLYGKKGMGMIRNPKKSLYNKVYNKTTFDVFKIPYTSSKSSSKKNISNKEFNNNLKELGVEKDSFTYKETVKVENKHKGSHFILIGTVIGFLSYDLLGAIVGSILAYLLIKRHNKKPPIEYKDNTKKLSETQINELMNEIVSKLEDYNNSVNILAETNKPELFFNNLFSAEENIHEVGSSMNQYNVPNFQSNVKDLPKLFDEHKDALISEFIKKYYQIEEESASKLKTERGYNNRLNNKKDDLLVYSHLMNKEQLELIDELWSSSNFLK